MTSLISLCVAITDYAATVRLSDEGIENLKQGITPEELTGKHASSYGHVVVTMRFGLHDGKNIYRQYAVRRETALLTGNYTGLRERIITENSFSRFPFATRIDIVYVFLEDIYYKAHYTALLDRKQQDQLIEAYKEMS